MCGKSVLLKLEDSIVFFYLLAMQRLDALPMRCACVCLLRQLPVAEFGRQKVAVTHLCTFDRRFHMAEPGRTVMGGRYHQQRTPWSW